MAYIQVRFSGTSQEKNEMLIAMLSAISYEGFEEEKDELLAYIPVNLFDQKKLDAIGGKLPVAFSVSELADTNWNSVWESNFQPVTVGDFCAIRADFHQAFPKVKIEIVITPKMSFGTGHHPTTLMMVKQMKDIDFTNKRVLDFGTGTGVLAILAEKLGAIEIIAFDNDDWSIANARENTAKNKCLSVEIIKADSAEVFDQSFDIILANITRNVILENLQSLVKYLDKKGTLLLSGLLAEDEPSILQEAVVYGLALDKKLVQDNWICLKLVFKND